MVNKQNNEEVQDDMEITNEEPDIDTTDPELSDIEDAEENKLKALRTKLREAEEKNRALMEDLQRTKADFLNGKRRLEDERVRDKDRLAITHIEKLLPLCDSFYLAMLDKEAWGKADEKWRKGVEGIAAQLTNVLSSYGVTSYDPTGEEFDPSRHEALSNITVQSEADHHKIMTVILPGYERTKDSDTEIIRPARVTVGEFTAS